MKLANMRSVYFIGIGGIGMSALARWFHRHGKKVAGYDLSETQLTRTIEVEGISVTYLDDPDTISTDFSDSETTLVVYTPAIPKDNKIYNHYSSGYILKKRSEVLGMITADLFTIAVAGTHGKTTTSTMIAHLLHSSNRNVTAFMGGISINYMTNILIAKDTKNETIVVEADEYDRSFLTLHPDYAIVTSVDADHLDIYSSAENLEKSFLDFVNNISTNGKLIMSTNVLSKKMKTKSKSFYGFSGADSKAENIRIKEGYFTFDYSDPDYTIKNIRLLQPGYHNIENAVAAIKTCLDQGLSVEEVKSGLSTYRGVKRRFEYIIRTENLVFIDDYAHHPVEIDAFLTSLKAMYPDKRVTVVFQPHLYSRTADFAQEFGRSLSLADEVILLEIYPAREKPMEGVSSQLILDKIEHPNKRIIPKSKIVSILNSDEIEVLATMGAGDIDQLVLPIKQKLTA